MRSRPEIELRVPAFVLPGDDVQVTVLLRSASDTPVERIEITLIGVESAKPVDRSGNGVERTIHMASSILSGESKLWEGMHTLAGSLPLPAEMPFTYIGYASEIRYSVRVHVVIPWWPDASESSELLVRPRPAARPARLPATITTENGDRLFVEMAIDDRAFAPGDEIAGAVALGNLHTARVRGIDISLVAIEHLRLSGLHNSELAVEANRYSKFFAIEASDEGREISFRIDIPKDAMTSFDEGLMALVWGVEVRVDLGLASDVTAMIPIVLGAFDRARKKGAHSRPRIGSGRWRDVWSGAAARSGLSLDPDELRLTGLIQGYEASIAVDDTGDKKGTIVVELRWPSFGIGLQIDAGRRSLALFTSDDELSRRYRVRGRDPSQVAAVLTPPLRSALLAFESVELDDNHALVTARGPAHDARWLAGLLELVFALAASAREAASQIPPPPSMATMQPAWQAFADELGGHLSIGSMSIDDGRLEGGTFTIETRFEGGSGGSGGGALPSRTVVALALDPPLSKPFDPLDPAQLAAAPAGTREIVASIRAHASPLRVTEERMEADAAAPLEHPGSLREVMRAMLALAQRLGGDRHGGPYR